MDAEVPGGAVTVTLAEGTVVVVRPIGPDDESRMATFHAGLSSRSVHQRYFHITSLAQRVAQSRLALTCRVDAAIGRAIVAERTPAGGSREVLALGRLTRTGPEVAEFALLVVDRWQGLGLGRAMMTQLLVEARALALRRIYGDMLADNDAMRAVARRAGFVVRAIPGDAAVLRAERVLT